MIEQLTGTIIAQRERYLTVQVNGLGFGIAVPSSDAFTSSPATVYTYVHWSQDKGATMYGFHDELTRTVFLLLLDCPKVGPGTALGLLAQITASQMLEVIASQNEAALSAIKGIGAKTAEQIIVSLKNKVSKLMNEGALPLSSGGKEASFAQWQQVHDALSMLNYSKQEISGALQHLTESYSGQPLPEVSVLIRRALGYLAQS
jgi:Holliday junction DNA helicase RuvA